MTETASKLLALFEPHRNFTRIFQDAYALVSAEGKVLRHNQAFCTLTGKTAYELKHNSLFYHLLVDPEPNGPLATLLDADTPQRVDEMPVLRKSDSNIVQVITSSYPYQDEKGRLLGVCLLFRDVTAESNLQGKYKQRQIESITDPLTKLYTRRYISSFMKEFHTKIGTAEEDEMSVVLLDIDHFKNVNDTLGHAAGDLVLKQVAELMRSQCRATDRLARYGGEEFLMVLPGTDLSGACAVAEKIRSSLESAQIEYEGKNLPVTISCGVAQWASHIETEAQLLHRADVGLYAAKKNGRNVSIVSKGDSFWVIGKDGRLTRELMDSQSGSSQQSA